MSTRISQSSTCPETFFIKTECGDLVDVLTYAEQEIDQWFEVWDIVNDEQEWKLNKKIIKYLVHYFTFKEDSLTLPKAALKKLMQSLTQVYIDKVKLSI